MDQLTANTGQSSTQKPKKKRTAVSYAIAFWIKILVTALIIWLTLTFAASVQICHDRSSYPMLKDGDLCITWRLGELKQGDLIAYRKDDSIHFSRVVATADESVAIYNDYITIDGEGIYEDENPYPVTAEGSAVSFPYRVPKDCVFVLNDYRPNLSDSRTYGGIPLEDSLGKIVFVMRKRGI